MFKCMFFGQYKLLMRTDDRTELLGFHAAKIYANALVAVVANGAVDRKLKHDSFWRFMGSILVVGP